MTALEEIKKRKPFAAWDLLVYAVLAAFIAVLFAVFFLKDRSPISGIEIEIGEERVYTYSFRTGGGIASAWESRVSERREGDLVLVTVQTGDGGYNILEINVVEKSAKMRDANCSRRKDCTVTAALVANGGVIVCVPHGLKVLALDGQEDLMHPAIG